MAKVCDLCGRTLNEKEPKKFLGIAMPEQPTINIGGMFNETWCERCCFEAKKVLSDWSRWAVNEFKHPSQQRAESQ